MASAGHRPPHRPLARTTSVYGSSTSHAHNLPYNACVLILISAGEASGEMYGAQLIEALVRAAKNSADLRPAGHPGKAVPTQVEKLSFFGVGGDRMRAAGCDTVVDAKDLAVVRSKKSSTATAA